VKKKELKPESERFKYGGWLDLGLQVAITLALSVLLMGLAGKWIDGMLGTYPLFLIIGVLWGAGGGTVWLIVRVKQYAEKEESENKTDEGEEN